MTGIPSTEQPLICALTQDGEDVPLFIAPSAGSTPLSLVPFARALKPPRPVYGFKAAGTEDRRPPHSSIEDIAAANIAEIRDIRPSGPYLIAGHCFGGVPALEMARQIEAAGETVSRLMLLDTFLPIRAEMPAGQSAHDMEIGEAKLREALDAVHEQARRQFAMMPPDVAGRFDRALRLQIAAGLKYRCRPVNCPVTLIRTPSHDDILFQDWSAMAPGGFDRIDIPGETFTILRPPLVGTLGARAGAILNQPY